MHHQLDMERQSSINAKPRKMSTGGNRSWSEEEVNHSTQITSTPINRNQEAYLIQTRMQKMPYKHIAAHLKKTELACRLHYHQLTHGNHRRRRQSTSTNSSTSSTSSRYSINQLPLPGFDPHTLASQSHGALTGYHLGHNAYSTTHHSPGKLQHKLLLPKPPTITPESSPDRSQGLRFDAGMLPQPSVDPDRLHSIYNSHRGPFWSAIAAEYGNNLSPGQLEDIWRHNTNSFRRPPTPDGSPNSSTAHLLKPSPFPNYSNTTLQNPKDYGVGHMMTGMTTQDRMYSMAPMSSTSYDALPSLPRLDTRQPSWSNPSAGVPATAITALLTEDKCPRHAEYCGGRCYGNH
jgi:hypothetical protein